MSAWLDSLTAWQSLLLYVELQTFSKVFGCRCTDEIWMTSWWHLRQRQELMQETELCYIFVSRTENCSAKLTCFMLDQRIDISNSHFWDCPVFKSVFKVNNWRLVWEATKVEKLQAQAVQELTGKLRHGGMANLRMLRIRFEQSRMKSRTTRVTAEWSEWQWHLEQADGQRHQRIRQPHKGRNPHFCFFSFSFLGLTLHHDIHSCTFSGWRGASQKTSRCAVSQNSDQKCSCWTEFVWERLTTLTK